MSGERLNKQSRKAIKKQRKIVKTQGYAEGEKILTAIRQHREMYDYNR